MNKPIIVVLIFSLLWGCSNNDWDIDISDIQIDQDFKRFDQELFNVPHDSVWNYVEKWEKEYPRFFSVYNTGIIKIGGTNQLNYDEKLVYFLTDPDIEGAFEMVRREFANLNFKNTLRDAFKRYHYYFPNKDIPDIYTHISGFNQSVIVDSNYISISLDKYLGKDTKYYQMLRAPMYKREKMIPEKIPADVIYALAVTEFDYQPKKDNLISQMIYYGKIHLFMKALLPNTADNLLWGFSEEKMEWCEKNERQMWMYLVENKMLFTTSYKDIKRYIDDGPFTSTFSKQSPGRSGRWLGYQIIRSYMKQHPTVTLKQLMEMQDYQKILNESKYRP